MGELNFEKRISERDRKEKPESTIKVKRIEPQPINR
jgi:hypothetical protein